MDETLFTRDEMAIILDRFAEARMGHAISDKELRAVMRGVKDWRFMAIMLQHVLDGHANIDVNELGKTYVDPRDVRTHAHKQLSNPERVTELIRRVEKFPEN